MRTRGNERFGIWTKPRLRRVPESAKRVLRDSVSPARRTTMSRWNEGTNDRCPASPTDPVSGSS
jgi:hypothetical protein